MMMFAYTMLVAVVTAGASAAEVGRNRFGMGDLSNAMGSTVEAPEVDVDLYFEPHGTALRFWQAAPDGNLESEATLPDGFEALAFDTDCGEHGCAPTVSAVTVLSASGGARSETSGMLVDARTWERNIEVDISSKARNPCRSDYQPDSFPFKQWCSMDTTTGTEQLQSVMVQCKLASSQQLRSTATSIWY